MNAEVLTVSSKGQVVLPAKMRKTLEIETGDKLAAFFTDTAIMLKPIKLPTTEEFSRELDKAEKWASESGLSENDVMDAINVVRSKKRQ